MGLQRLLDVHDTKVRFVVVGAINTTIGLSSFPILFVVFRKSEIPYLWLLTLAQLFNASFAFLTNKLVVFRSSGRYASEYGKFILFHVIVYALNLAVLPAMVEGAGISPPIAQTMFALLVIITSSLWH